MPPMPQNIQGMSILSKAIITVVFVYALLLYFDLRAANKI